MTTAEQLAKLKSRVKSLETELASKTELLGKYQSMGDAADEKIQALTKIHNDKIRSLMNSIQMLKKENATLENQGKEHKRSKLIGQLNKEIDDQDRVIEVLRNYIYKKEGSKEAGRTICDQIIVQALTKGPDRIRALSREQLKMEIERLKNQFLLIKQGGNNNNVKPGTGNNNSNDNNRNPAKGDENKDDSVSMSNASGISQESGFDNISEEMLKQLQQTKMTNETLKLELITATKTIERLTEDLRSKSAAGMELQTIKSELEVANRKVETLQGLLKQTKEHSNNKIIELYEREIKVEQLQLMSKQHSNKLNLLQQTHSIQAEEMRLEKEKVIAELDSVTKQNERLILENITIKKRLEEQKNKINEIRDLNQKQKEELGAKLLKFEQEISRIIKQSDEKSEKLANLEKQLKEEKNKAVEEKTELLTQIEELRAELKKGMSQSKVEGFLKREQELKEQIEKLRNILESGSGGGSSQLSSHLLSRLKGYQKKVEILEKQLKQDGKLGEQDLERLQGMDKEWFEKYMKVAREFEEYKINSKIVDPKTLALVKNKKPAEIIDLNRDEKNRLQNLSSDLSRLDLASVDQRILNNYDSSYEYSIHTISDQQGMRKQPIKIAQGDKQLMKLINSDLWEFINQDKLGDLIDDAASMYDSNYDANLQVHSYIEDDYEWDKNYKQLIDLQKKMPRANDTKVSVFKEELQYLDNISESVSEVSIAGKRSMANFDSEVELKLRQADFVSRIQDDNEKPLGLRKQDLAKLGNISSDIPASVQDLDVSKARSGQSNVNINGKRKPGLKDKGTRLASKLGEIGSDYESMSNIKGKLEDLNSDISLSESIKSQDLQSVTSSVSFNFMKKPGR